MTDSEKAEMARRVRQEFLHAWDGYRKYAWGHDALMPLSHKPHDWYAHSLLMTPVDGLDTMILMGLKPQADEARRLIDTQLNFDQEMYVKDFEITIRLLGSLLSSYELTGDKRLLELADDLGRRMLPMFNSPTGMPYEYVNLRTGAVRGAVSNPAEIGSLLIEYGMLARQAGVLRQRQSGPSSSCTSASRRPGWWDQASTSRLDNGPIRRRESWAGLIPTMSTC